MRVSKWTPAIPRRTSRGLTHWHVPLLLVLLLAAGGEVVLTLQETPLGSMHGVVSAEETGVPIRNARVTVSAQFEMEGTRPEPIYLWTDERGEFAVERLPAGEYEVQADAKAHKLQPMRVTVQEGAAVALALELAPEPSWLELRAQEHVFAPRETPAILCRGFVQDDQFVVRAWRVDYAKLMLERHGYLYELVAEADSQYLAGLAASPLFADVGAASVRITERDREGIIHQRVPVRLPGPGLYVVSIEADNIRKRDWLMVTDLGLVTKRLGESILAFAVELDSGKPIQGVTVTAHRGPGVVASAQTGADGLAHLGIPRGTDNGELVVMATHGDSLAAIESYHWSPEAEAHRVYVYTDRPVYRPGHTVRYKGIVREIVGDRYQVPTPQTVSVEVRDDLDTLMHRAQLRTSEWGSFNDAFDLPPTAGTGMYQMTTTVAGRPYHSNFTVAAYRKPEYSVTVSPERPRYVRGDEAVVSVEAEYYFGMPVADAEVEYYVYRAPYWFAPVEEGELEGYEGEYGYEYDEYGEMVASGTARTDERGIARLRVDTRAPEDEELDSDFRFRVEVSVTDPSRIAVGQSGTFTVTRGEFAILVEPDRYACAPDEAVNIALRAMDYEEKPRAKVTIEVSAGPEEWLERGLRYEEELTQRVTTDAEGRAKLSFTPKREGRYRITANALDERRNKIAASTDLWVTSEMYASLAYKYPELEIITDKRAFEVGETVTAMINTKATGAVALVTIEGEKLHEWRTLPLQDNSTTVRIPIKREYMPNVYLSVCYVKDKELARASVPLRVSTQSRSVVVELTPNKQKYAPGEAATCRIKTTRPGGRPVSAEVSLGVVDEAIYAIREEPGPDILSFFYERRSNLVETSYSFPRLYLDNGDKAGDEGRVRKWFPDTALWAPAVVTNAQGVAEVTFRVPDTLTTWRATARAHTLDTSVGTAVTTVRCAKDFLVRLQTPRFATQGDEVTISGIVHNDTEQAQQVTMELAAPGLKGSMSPYSARVQPTRLSQRDWPLVASLLGPQPITVRARGASGLQDAMQLQVPVLPHGRERVEWRNGTVSSAVTEKLQVRDDAVPGASSVRVMLTPSVASCMLGSLEYLVSYPYGCTEQTMSAFLPDVVVARVLRELNLQQPELEKRLPDMVRAGLLKLYDYQHSDDGGWGWCEYDRSDPWMTGYVVFGLLQAKAAGFAVNERVLGEGLRAMRNLAQQHGIASSTRAYLDYVLATAGDQQGYQRLLKRMGPDLSAGDPRSLAYLVLACLHAGDRANAERAMLALWHRAEETASLCYWSGQDRWNCADTETETSALALKAAVHLQPSDPRISKIARWLVLNRQGDHWYSTRDTAMVLYALADLLRQSRELEPNYDATVTLNGKPLGAPIHFDRRSLFAPQVELSVGGLGKGNGAALKAGDNILRLDKRGPGTLYYAVRFVQYVGTEDLPLRVGGAGIVIERNYYKLSLQREDVSGQLKLLPSKSPRREFRSGELIRARVSVQSARPYEYMMIEDPLPAGCEVIERGDVPEWEWEYWWSDMDVRDEMVSFFARELPTGRHVIEYMLRAQIPGEYHVMPTRAYGMYRPEIRGDGPENRIRIEG